MTNLPRPTLIQRAIALTIASAATLVIVAGSASPASAASVAAPRTAIIDVSGIDLASAAGHARVASEVTRAAKRVCSTDGDRALATHSARRACIETAIAMAMPQLAVRADTAQSIRTTLADAGLTIDTVGR